MPRGPRKQRLNLFLTKERTTRQEVVRDDIDGLVRFSIVPGLNFEGDIIVKGAPANPPRWRQFVQSGTRQELGTLLNQSASCLIVLSIGGRVFAIAFGFARHWIDERRIVRRFGMIVTLNVVHPERIRSIDREEFETIQRKTRSQTSVSSNINSFGLDVQRDLVRAVTGQPEDQSFAQHVTGADNLIFSVPITFDQLGDKCVEALRHFESTNYRERYPWIDNFTRVADPQKIDELDEILVDRLRAGGAEGVFLTPPDTLDFQEHRGFRYPHERRQASLHPDLRIEELLAQVGVTDITLETLKKWRIREYTVDDETPSRQFPVYDALIFEVPQGQKLFVLSRAEWFEIAQDYVAAVNEAVAQIRDHDGLQLIDARPREIESEYNARAVEASGGTLALLDRRTIAYGGGRSSIEVCDLLSLNRDFVHVKAKTKSSTLSHLFAQGLNSAQAFRDAGFRQLALTRVPETHRFIFEDERPASDYTVTYAIMTEAAGELRGALPFFSKQSLANAARALTNMGYHVRLKKVLIVPN